MSTVSKSYCPGVSDPVIEYTSRLTAKLAPIQKELQEATLKIPMGRMLGAPEALTIGQHFINLIGAKNILDIGTFTGASALAWSLAIPDDGKVFTLDVNLENFKNVGVPIISKNEKVFAKINPVEGAALEFLDKQIADGKAGTFDFAFIDADKESYPNYYERVVTLLRSGGVLMVDNALRGGTVAKYDPTTASSGTKAIDECNHQISKDDRTNSFLINCADGLHFAFKK